MLLLVKWHALAYNFIKRNTPPWVFFENCANGTKSRKVFHMYITIKKVRIFDIVK